MIFSELATLNQYTSPVPLPPIRFERSEELVRGGEGTNRSSHERLSSRRAKNNSELATNSGRSQLLFLLAVESG